MSNTEKRPLAQMERIANGLVARLKPACHRIEIAGSIRRKKAMIGDIELIAVPILHTNLFDEPLETSQVDDLLASWPIAFIRNGPKQKSFTFEGTTGGSYKVDLFLQPNPATWGVNMMIRTGDEDFSKKMVIPKWQGGYMPDQYKVDKARVWENGVALSTPNEIDVFRLWDMAYIVPEHREVM